ncbi:MAG: J domain-containing protein [Hyphomicrobium sp.]
MFDRTRVDTATQQQMTVPVEVTLEDGDCIRGKFIVPASRTLFDVLNNAGAFIEFEPYGGERSILAKTAIKAVRLVNMPAQPKLEGRAKDIDNFDPYGVLGVPRGAAFEDCRHAYLKLAKTYHPDCYTSVELPAEVRDYLSSMARRINAAYAALEEPAQAKKVAAQRAAPVFTSAVRA